MLLTAFLFQNVPPPAGRVRRDWQVLGNTSVANLLWCAVSAQSTRAEASREDSGVELLCLSACCTSWGIGHKRKKQSWEEVDETKSWILHH